GLLDRRRDTRRARGGRRAAAADRAPAEGARRAGGDGGPLVADVGRPPGRHRSPPRVTRPRKRFRVRVRGSGRTFLQTGEAAGSHWGAERNAIDLRRELTRLQ